jgi:hypothetical protein
MPAMENLVLPAPPPRIFVFDFDQTITHVHTGGCAVNPVEIEEAYIRANLKEGFVELVQYLEQLGCRTYIATYGDDSFGDDSFGANRFGPKTALAGHALVKRYMDVALGEGQEHFYFDHDTDGEIWGTIIAKFSGDGKHYHLERILAREKLDGSDPAVMRDILLIDDDAKNVDYFASRGCITLAPDSSVLAARLAMESGILLRLLAALRCDTLGLRAAE